MDKILIDTAKEILDNALLEDLGTWGDITTFATASDEQIASAQIIAKQEGVISGLEIAELVFTSIDNTVTCKKHVSDGDSVNNRKEIMTITGKASSLLSAERTALNFLGHLSGVATLTSQFVAETKGTKAKILDTRKTTPGWRLLEKYAVVCGGGMNHRMGLHDMFLIKDNHISHCGCITNSVKKCHKYMEEKRIQAPIEVEVKNLSEFREAASLDVDRIMLDNMSDELIQECIKANHGNIPLEISGNVNLDTVKRYAQTGVDFISVGALTHSFRNFDFSMLF